MGKALATIAQTLRGVAYLNIPDATQVSEALAYRENFSQREVMLIWPNFTAWDTSTDSAVEVPSAAYALGLRAAIDEAQGWHKTLSNVAVQGVTRSFVTVTSGIVHFTETFPRLTTVLVAATTAFLGFKTAVAGAQWLSTFGAIGKGGALLKALVPGLGLAQHGVLALTGAFRTMGLAALASPVGLVVAGIAGAGFLVWKYWKPIKAFFVGMFQGIGEALAPVGDMLSDMFEPLKPAWAWIKDTFGSLFTQTEAGAETLTTLGTIGRAVGKVLGFTLGGAIAIVGTGIKALVSIFQGTGEAIGYIAFRTVDFFTRAWDNAVKMVGGVLDILTGIFTLNGEKIGAGWDALTSGLGDQFGLVFDGIKQTFADAIAWIVGKFDWVIGKWDAFKGAIGLNGGPDTAGLGDGPAAADLTWNDGSAAGLPVPPPRLPAPASRGSTVDQSTHTTQVSVQATPGMDERKLAQEVRRQLDERDRAQSARRRSTLGDTE